MFLVRAPFSLSNLKIYRPERELAHFFWAGMVRRVAQVFIAVFEPVYVYQIFQKLGFDTSLSILYVTMFILLMLFSKLCFLGAAENISINTGFKGIIWLSAVPYIFYIPCLIYASVNPYFLIPAAVFFGAHSSFYWWGYHGYFVKAGDSTHYGQGLGEIEFLNTFAVVLTPLIGAVVIKELGFGISFFAAATFMLLSLLLLGRRKDISQKHDIKFKEVVKLLMSHKSSFITYAASSSETTFYIIFWPLFLFLFLGGVVGLGTFITISSLIAAFVSIFIGKKIDEQGEKGVISISSPIVAFSWFIKVIIQSTPILIFAESLRNFGERMMSIALMDLTYKKAIEAYTGRAILFREISALVGAILTIILFAIWVFLGFGFASFFVVIGIVSLIPLFYVYTKKL